MQHNELLSLDLVFEGTPINEILKIYTIVQKELIERLDLDYGFPVDVHMPPYNRTVLRGELEDAVQIALHKKDADVVLGNLNLLFPREKHQFSYPLNNALHYITRNHLEELLRGIEE